MPAKSRIARPVLRGVILGVGLVREVKARVGLKAALVQPLDFVEFRMRLRQGVKVGVPNVKEGLLKGNAQVAVDDGGHVEVANTEGGSGIVQ